MDQSSSDRAARRRLPPSIMLAVMISAVATAAEPEPPVEGTPTEVSGLPESDDQAHEIGAPNQGDAGLIKSKGAFAKVWNRQSFIEPGLLASPGSHQAAQLRLPGDFEKHRALVLAGGWLAREAPGVLCDVVKQTKSRMRIVLLVSSPREQDLASRLLAESGLPPDTLRFLTVPIDTGWVRDFGPIFVCGAAGVSHAIDAAYDRPGRDRDDAAAHTIADLFEVATKATPLRWHGGNLLSNGRGLLVTTTQSVNANIECGFDADAVTRFLGDRLGADQIVVLEHLQRERTGHVDMFACFTSPDTILVGEYEETVDPENAAVLNRNAARLAEVRTREAKLEVIRVPMPSNRDGKWRSFTNVIFADGTLLVPIYPDVAPSGAENAMAIYRRLLPGWKVLGVDAGGLARHQGGLRCVTLYVPGE